MRNGASQPGSAASASSDRSGHASPSARRRNITRSRRCLSAFVHGRRARPSERTPRASMSAAASSCGTGSVCSARMSAPSRRRRRARNDAEARSKLSSSAVSIEPPAIRLDVVERERRGREDTRRGGAAGDFADGEIRLARQRIMRFQRRRPAVGHEEFAAPAARHGDAVREGRGEKRSGATLIRLRATFSQREKGAGVPMASLSQGLFERGARPSPSGRRWPKAG